MNLTAPIYVNDLVEILGFNKAKQDLKLCIENHKETKVKKNIEFFENCLDELRLKHGRN